MRSHNQIIVMTQEPEIADDLQLNLKDFEVVKAASVADISTAAKRSPIAAFIIHPRNSNDWMNFEFLNTAHSKVPRFAILDSSAPKTDAGRCTEYGASAIFDAGNTSALATLIRSSINGNETAGDRNAEFLKNFGGISRELQRLQGEFTETALRTLPQPNIGTDTERNLKDILTALQGIRIAP